MINNFTEKNIHSYTASSVKYHEYIADVTCNYTNLRKDFIDENRKLNIKYRIK